MIHRRFHVRTATGKMSLIEYLTSKYPDNFKLIKAGSDPISFNWGTGWYSNTKRFDFESSRIVGGQLSDVLVIRKTRQLPELNLALDIDLDRHSWVKGESGFEFSTDNQYYETP